MPTPPTRSRVASVAPLPVVLGQDGHEGLREGALGEHPAQDVGQPECGLERVHLRAGAEDRGLQALAGEPVMRDSERHPADGGQGAKEIQVWAGRGGATRRRNLLSDMRKTRYYVGLAAIYQSACLKVLQPVA